MQPSSIFKKKGCVGGCGSLSSRESGPLPGGLELQKGLHAAGTENQGRGWGAAAGRRLCVRVRMRRGRVSGTHPGSGGPEASLGQLVQQQ